MSVDPSHTQTLRREFAQHLRGIWARINAQARRDITERDVLGLQSNLVNNARAPDPIHDLSFKTDDSKIEAFKQWLRRQAKKGRLEVFSRNGNTYIKSAYQRGMRNADTALRKQGVDVGPVEISAAFNMPVHQQQVQNLYTRVLSEWEGIVAAVEQQVARELANGFAQGDGVYKIAKRISDRIESVGKKRATDLARTEVIRASADGALNRYEQYGVDEVAGEAEFLATDDERTCPICEGLDGNVYTIAEARGLIPQHVRCRCTWSPVVDKSDQLTLDTTGNSVARQVA